MLNSGFRKDGFSVFASFNHDQTDGHRDSSDFKINNGYFSAGYDFSANFNLNADFSLAAFKATDPGPENLSAGDAIDITRGMGAVSFDNKFEKTNGSARFFYNFGDHDVTDGFHSEDKNFGATLYQSFSLIDNNVITLGADYKNYGGIAENRIVLGDTTISEAAGYIHIQQSFFEKLILNAGFRLEHNSVYGNEPVPSGGLAYNLNSSTTIKASIAKGFRSPTIRELYLFPPANDELKPERMVNYEVGLIQRLLEYSLLFEFNIYHADGNNLIRTLFGPGGPKNVNTGSFSNTGIEVLTSWVPLPDLTTHVNYSYISMKEPLLAAPKHQLNLGTTFTTQTSPVSINESYTLLNSRIAYKINKYLNVFLKGENLTNKKYYINYGYPMPGFIVFGGINLYY
jgi:iron complex outermembrane receptor protein